MFAQENVTRVLRGEKKTNEKAHLGNFPTKTWRNISQDLKKLSNELRIALIYLRMRHLHLFI